MAKNKVNTNDLIDYYVYYSIDRRGKTKEIRKQLLQRQGELRSKMSNGSLNSPEIMKKLQEAFDELASAVKIFKNEDRRKEYDAMLNVAYEQGSINPETQITAQSLYEEIEALFLKGNYNEAIRKCMNALENNVKDYRIYILLAQSYFALNETDNSLSTVDDGLRANPGNMQLLRAGARFSNEGKQDFDRSQMYVNRMTEIDPDNSLAASEQSYLYMSMGKEDLAYNMIDEYAEKHPNNMEFRKDVAYDLVGFSYSSCYTKAPDSDAFVIASEENYQRCLASCNKAVSLYNDENTQEALDNAKYYGKVEFNDENKESIKWLFIGGLVYLLGGGVTFFLNLESIIQQIEIDIPSLVGGIVMVILGILLIFCGIMLRKVSFRPYWQINKFILTGKREKGEKIYILIGSIFAGYMKWCVKITNKLVHTILRISLGAV